MDLGAALKKRNQNSDDSDLWAQAHPRWTETKWKTVQWSDKKNQIKIFGNHVHQIRHAKEEWDHLACYQHKVLKPL